MLSKTTSLLMIPLQPPPQLLPLLLLLLLQPVELLQLLHKETQLTEQTILRKLNQRRRRERNSQCHMQETTLMMKPQDKISLGTLTKKKTSMVSKLRRRSKKPLNFTNCHQVTFMSNGSNGSIFSMMTTIEISNRIILKKSKTRKNIFKKKIK